ncbi:MAG: hypothetical protein IK109_00390 [Clostridiales bacterium]|nr:hypothetical protein [Clostridiales bacterium]MBR5416468.1 hypothetical protein [Clostridiales bacterium]
MKKWWQQVNRGLLLLALAVLAVSVYLIIYAAEIKKDKKVVKEISEQFISDSSVYFICPSDLDFWAQEEFTEDELSSSMSAQLEPVSSYYCENDAVRDMQIKYYFSFFATTRENQICPVNCVRKPLKVDIEEIYNGSATVVVNTQTTMEYKKEDETMLSEVFTSDETLTFLKQDGEWKLVSVTSNVMNIEQ